MNLLRRNLTGSWILLVQLLACPFACGQFVSGTYAGDGNTPRSITNIGFQPNVVIIKANSTAFAAVLTSTMAADNTKITGASANAAGHILSIDSRGFTISNSANVNTSGTNYYWVAFKQVAGKVKVGTYTGNAANDRSITGVGFQPTIVIVLPEAAQAPTMRTATMAGDTTQYFSSTAASSDRIQALEADGFQIGTDNEVNKNANIYHYIAWKTTAGEIYESSFAGDNTDNRNITGVGFQPEWVIVFTSGTAPAHHSSAVGISTDSAQTFNGNANGTNKIQALQADGFQVGTSYDAAATTYYFTCFARSEPTAVKLTDFSARRHGDRVRIHWKTGLETDNLGFHLWREEGGKKVRLTRDLVAGSALLSGPGTVLTCGRSYSLWDAGPEAARGRYWLEEVDLNGKSILHGPFLVEGEDGRRHLLPEAQDGPASSKLLSEVGRAEAALGCGACRSWPRDLVEPGVDGPAPALLHRALGAEPSFRWKMNLADPQKVQWGLAAAPALKLSVREPGWYRLEERDLLAAGFDPGRDLRLLQLWNQGVEEPILLKRCWGRLGQSSFTLEFAGRDLDSLTADARTYWLTKGSEPGKRIATIGPSGLGWQSGAASFPLVVERKDRTVYFAAVRNGDQENFFGPPISIQPVEETLTLHHLDTSSHAGSLLKVSLQGLTKAIHQVDVSINGALLGQMVFEGQEREESRWLLSPGILREGENQVTLAPAGDEGDVSLPDRVQITYRHTYAADEDFLWCTVPGRQTLRIGGFSSPQIRVADITDPGSPRLLRGSVEREPGGFAVKLKVAGPRSLYAFAERAVARPAALEINQSSRWNEADSEGDEVIIAEKRFLPSVEPLRRLRESQGYKVAVADVQDIYDEFNFGEKDPQALKDFLRRAHERWKVPPRFVLLVGDSSFDPRNRLDHGDLDLVPTKLIDTAVLETASDDWFVDFDDDTLPDLAIGRLPVRTPEEASLLVGKIVDHESAGAAGSEVVLVSDSNKGFDFETENGTLAAMVPGGIIERSIFRGRMGSAEARSDLLQGLLGAPLLVNYVGHGSVELWAGNLLTTEDMAGLSSGRGPSFYVLMTCFNGFFHDLFTESLAEGLLNRTGNAGAFAVWASSGFTSPGSHGEMNRELFRLLFEEGLTLGEATARAKAAAFDADVRRTWVFFGDPAVRLR